MILCIEMNTKNASVHTDVQLSYRDVQLLQEMYSCYVEMYSYCLEMYSYYRCTAITENENCFTEMTTKNAQYIQMYSCYIEMYSYYKRCTAVVLRCTAIT